MLKLKIIRQNKGMSRYRLMKLTNLNYRTLEAIENGGDVRLSTLRKIAEALGVDVKELIE